MNDPEHFIARWSRRKQQAADDADEAKPSSVPATSEAARPIGNEGAAGNAAEDQPGAAGQTPPAFDLTQLPSLDTIAAGTDLRAFLAPGVPPELTRAALQPRVGGGPGDPRFCRARRIRLGFQHAGIGGGFRPVGDDGRPSAGFGRHDGWPPQFRRAGADGRVTWNRRGAKRALGDRACKQFSHRPVRRSPSSASRTSREPRKMSP